MSEIRLDWSVGRTRTFSSAWKRKPKLLQSLAFSSWQKRDQVSTKQTKLVSDQVMSLNRPTSENQEFTKNKAVHVRTHWFRRLIGFQVQTASDSLHHYSHNTMLYDTNHVVSRSPSVTGGSTSIILLFIEMQSSSGWLLIFQTLFCLLCTELNVRTKLQSIFDES